MHVPCVVPTHGRSKKVLTFDAIDDIILCVAESQLPLYKETYPDAEYSVHPDSVVGLSAKRQWIYEEFGDVFMLDDDAVALYDMTHEAGSTEASKISPKRARAMLDRLYTEAKDLGVYLWGFFQSSDPRMYGPQNPFKVTGYVLGGSIGLCAGSRIHFPKEINTIEDFWAAGLNAHYHRKIWVDRRYAFKFKDTFKGKGGCSQHRTIDVEKRGNEMLRKAFGTKVIIPKAPTPLTGVRHPGQRTFKSPFNK